MQILIDKSAESIKAGNALISNNMYTNSVHCFYYSCIQIMIACYCKKKGITKFETYQDECDNQQLSSHIWLSNNIYRLLDNVKGINDDMRYKMRTRFNFLINDLKDKRVAADYRIKKFEEEDLKDIVKSANEIVTTLTEKLL